MERIIFHVDVNSAFLSWSALKRLKEDPSAVDLRTVPSAVGGDRKTRHGIITAKSIPAKKKGVVTGEPVVKALEKCPELILIPSDFATYRKYSHMLMDILRDFTEEIEPASIDEAYMDVTELIRAGHVPGEALTAQEKKEAERLSGEIRRRVREELGFTVNAGISSNKLLAKMASDFEKPDRTHTLWPEEVETKMWPLPIGQLYGCGRKTAEKIRGLGLYTIGDVAAADPAVLKSFLGEKAGEYIFRSSRGIGNTAVQKEREEAKSYSNETTTPKDITEGNYETLMPELLEKLSASVSRRMQRDGVYGSTASVIVKTDSFRRHTRQMTVPPTNDADEICRAAQVLMKELLFGTADFSGLFSRGDNLRLVGVRMSSLDDGAFRQVTIGDFLKTKEEERLRKEEEEAKAQRSEERREKDARLDAALKRIRTKYGEGSVTRGLP